MLFTWLMLVGIILLIAPQNLTGKFQLGFVRVFRWPLSVGGNLALTANTQQPLQDAFNRKEAQYLNHIANLEQTLRRQREKFEKLPGAHNSRYVWEGTDFALADVITATIDESHNELTISYRKSAALVKGQFVLGDNAIIGTISDASSGTACVKLFTDRTSKIAVSIGKMKFDWIMQGNGNGSARVLLVPTKYRIKTGDKVYASSKQSQFLDAPVIIGTVTKVAKDRDKPLLWVITVEPACDIEKLEDVLVIIMNPQK